MSPQRRLLAGSIAFCWGVGASTWLQATLRWLTLTPDTASLPPLGAMAVLILGFGAGAAWARPGSRRADTALSIVLAATTSLLGEIWSPAAPLLATLGAGALGIGTAQRWPQLPAVLLGAGLGGILVSATSPALLGISGTTLVALALLLPALAQTSDGLDAARSRETRLATALLAGGLTAIWATVATWMLDPLTGRTHSAHSITLAVLAVGLGAGICLPARTWVRPLLALAGGLALTLAHPTFDAWSPALARMIGGLESRLATLVLLTMVNALLVLPWSTLCGTLLPERSPSPRGFAAAMLGAALSLSAQTLLLWSPLPAPWDTPFEQRYGPLVEHRVGVRGSVLVTDDPEQGRILRHGSGRIAGAVGSDASDRVAAQIPMLLHPHPERILLLDFSVGNEASTMLAHPIERLDAIDLGGAARTIAPLFDESNLDVLSDERFVLHTAEPWSYLGNETAKRWDVIFWQVAGLAEDSGYRVPTRERIEQARARLAPGGLFALRLEVGSISTAEVRDVVATVAATFETTSIWEDPSGLYWILVAGRHSGHLDEERLVDLLRDPDVEAELGALELTHPAEILTLAIGGKDLADGLSKGARILTRDRTRLDQRVAELPDSYFGLGVVAADSPLGTLSDPQRRGGVGLARLFARIAEMRALRSIPIRPASEGEPHREPGAS